MQIAILGNSGSGKSTLAAWLAARGGAAVLDLDTVAWEPGDEAVPASPVAAAAAVTAFCHAHDDWVIEGCYASLVAEALSARPALLWLNPGVDVCLDHCRARPWEPHKYRSPEAQARQLEMLLAWVRDYYVRDGDMSWRGHRQLFLDYRGPKWELTAVPDMLRPSLELQSLLPSPPRLD